ncbi:tRNA1(Val) (adenine(37)-N6)-methyltransferase [Aquimarina agarilytica]|uniref:tRNA1(Val) (adenine(37)-N6)-methyltransferase n=1 Tax=Aquimarina agarilytica TaxID=1087449 RepID=UPI0002898BB5|nr:methyltransferase [Aquimarina agarilytica]
MSKPFKFKEFVVAQDQCAMKIGTDAVLLGAWVQPKERPFNVLDVGAGTGVIALMMAQRFFDADVEAIEIDTAAYEQAMTNFENSPWGDRMFCYHASFQEFFQEMEESYDLIISNPPYFAATQKSPNKQRNMARFEDALPFEHLLYGASKLLSEQGTFALIIPYEQQEQVLLIAKKMYLLPAKITHVKGNEQAPIKRSLIAFQFNVGENELEIDQLIIEKERHNYTDDYIKLVQDFYLKM